MEQNINEVLAANDGLWKKVQSLESQLKGVAKILKHINEGDVTCKGCDEADLIEHDVVLSGQALELIDMRFR